MPTWASAVEALDELNTPFQYSWGPVSHLLGVKNSPELRKAHEEVLPEVVSFSLRVSPERVDFTAALEVAPGGSRLVLAFRSPTADRRSGRSSMPNFVGHRALRCGRASGLMPSCRKLVPVEHRFSDHVLDATKEFSIVVSDPAEVEGLPPSLLRLASQTYNGTLAEGAQPGTEEAGPWRFTLEFPSYGPFMQHSRRRELREKMYRAYVTRASSGPLDNTPLIQKILALREEKARLLGFQTFAELSLAKKMAPSVSSVEAMFETLRPASRSAAEKELAEIRGLAADSGVREPLINWDIAFWSERLREKKFQFTDEELRPYFPLESVLGRVYLVSPQRLFRCPRDAGRWARRSVWNKDVRFFNISDESGRHIASFYLDPYSRPENKRGGAWMDDCLGRRRLHGVLQLPVAHLICNSTPPAGGKPSLMTFGEVETLFHEFGHGLQHMLTTVDYADAAGINGVEWDAVELPSQFMENWCYHRPTLMGLSSHYETGEPLPEELFEKICAARTFQAGMQMLRQILFGMTDMALHAGFASESADSIFALQRRISEQTSVLPLLPEDRSLCSFTHIFSGGYAAGYYSYKWAEVLSADAYSAFEEAGLENDQAVAQIGRRFRDTVLAKGGGRHPMEVFKEFRGREPNPEALLRHNGLA